MSGIGSRGWLVCFDKDRQQGKVYDPPFVVQLDRMKDEKNGEIAFQSKTTSIEPNKYLLRGKFDSAAIDGTLRVTSKEIEKSVDFQIHGIPIEDSTSQQDRATSGRYSSRRYIAEAGDLIGVDFLFFKIKGSPAGMITLYGGQLAAANWLVYDIKFEQPNKITFAVNEFGRISVCSAEFTAGQLRLQFLDNGSPIAGTTEVLKKQTGLIPVD